MSLLLVLAADAVRQGRRVYLVAGLGLALTLMGRMADGFMAPAADVALKLVGLLLAGLTLAFDLLTEVVEEPEANTGRPV